MRRHIRGIGIDVVDVKRFARFLDRNHAWLYRIFSGHEIARCEAARNRVERYAVRFAAKESVVKALETISMFDFLDKYSWADIEVQVDDLGKPQVVLHGVLRERVRADGIDGVEVSLSHSATIAMAQVILVGTELRKPRECGDVHR